MLYFIVIFSSILTFAEPVPLPDNILFAFEKCKTLSANLEKGQLREEVNPAFDVHCMKEGEKKLELKCSFFEADGNKKLESTVFTGGSDLGVGELKDPKGRKINFLLGKSFASFDSSDEHKVCVGIHIFEKDALKKSKAP